MTTISLTPDEYRLVLVHKVERALNECGITNIDRQTVDQIAALLAPPKIGEVPIQKPTLRRQGVETNPVRGDKRARAYLPTHKARQVDSPASTDDKVINAILENAKIQRPCMLPDLRRVTKAPTKRLYTVLWRLKRDGLIDVVPAASLVGHKD